METMAKRKWKRLGVNTLIVFVALALALCLAELVLRLASPAPVLEDPILGNIMRPGGEYDANGFRNAEVLSSASLVALGDSQTQGNNATREEAWPQVLGRLATTSIYQMALGGYGPVQYDYLADQALPLHPKAVIVGFYFGNDLDDAYRLAYTYDHWKDLRDKDFTIATTSTEGVGAIDYRTLLQTGLPPDSLQFKIYQVRLWIRAHSLLYAKLGDATRVLREKVGVAKSKDEKIAQVADYASLHPDLVYNVDESGIETILSPAYRIGTVSLSEPQTREGWRITENRFRDIGQKLRNADTRFILLVIPTKEEVYLLHMKHKTGKAPDVFALYNKNESELEERTKELCKREHIDCIFALPAMAAALDRGEAIYGKTFDGHPVPRGYRVIAETVYQYLKEHKLP